MYSADCQLTLNVSVKLQNETKHVIGDKLVPFVTMR